MDKTDILLYNDSEVPFYPRTNASSIKTTTESTNGSFMTQQEIDDALWDSRITKGTLLGTINGVEFNYGDDIAVSGNSSSGSSISLNTPLQDINNKLLTTPKSRNTYLKYDGINYTWDTASSTSSDTSLAKSLQILDNKNNGYSYNGKTNTILQFGSGITTKLSNTNDTQIVQVSVSGTGGSSGSGGSSGGGSSDTYTDLTVTGDLTVNGDISSTNIKNSSGITTNTLTVKDSLKAETGTIGTINSKTINSETITNSDTIKTKNLEVTGSAHFFELIIDKVKAAGGAVLFTPADGFDVDIVEEVDGGYKLYWQCQDGDGNQRENMWLVNDQALCQSFNQAKSGSGINNKYYWSLVTEVSNNPVEKDGEYYNYITISTTVCDGTVNPEKGDSIAMLGYRGEDDYKRQSAIYISAYTSLDKYLKPPLLAQYRGIKDFNLDSYRASYFDADGAKFVGNFEVGGESVEDYLASKISGIASGTPYIGEDGYWYVYDDGIKDYKNSGIKASGDPGEKGENADFYKMEPIYEYAIVDNNGTDGTLYVKCSYLIYHQVGDIKTTITPSKRFGYHVEYSLDDGKNWINDDTTSVDGNFNIINGSYNYKDCNKPYYVRIRLNNGSQVLETKSILVTYKASAMLTVDQNLNQITSRVNDCETSIDKANGNITTVTNNVSQLEQKANSITATVTSTKNEIAGDNILRGQNGKGWSGYVKYTEDDSSFTLSATEYTQSPPINDFMGNNLFSFIKANDYITMSIYEFTQRYNPDNSYNIECDFSGNITPCDFFDISSLDDYKNCTQTYIDTNLTERTVLTINKTLPTTYKVGDALALTIYNSTSEVKNYIYGTITEITEDKESFKFTIVKILKPAKLLRTINTSSVLELEEITDDLTEEQQKNIYYSTTLDRYWYRWQESQSSTKTFILRFKAYNVSGTAYPRLMMPMLEEDVTRPHRYSQQSQVTQSMIKQTAEEIKLAVNETYVKIGDGNITLNGDTKVVGNLTLTESNQGFSLLGSNAKTDIIADSIGTYNDFIQKESQSNFFSTAVDIWGTTPITSEFQQFNSIEFNGSALMKIGDRKNTEYISIQFKTQSAKITNAWNSSTKTWTREIAVSPTVSAYIVDGSGNIIHSFGVVSSNSTLTYTFILNVTDARVLLKIVHLYSYSAWKGNADTSTTITPLPKMSFYRTADISLPTEAHMLIGYDGWGVNFGTNKTVYCGSEGFIVNYGSKATFKITDNGIEQLNRRNVQVLNSTSSSTILSYTVVSPIDTVLCIGYKCMVFFPSNPYQGQELKIYDKAEYTYISSNGKYVVSADQKGNGSIYTDKELIGTVPRVYTYMNDRWYEEYTE